MGRGPAQPSCFFLGAAFSISPAESCPLTEPQTGMWVTEERSHQSRVSHRGTGVLPAPTPRPQRVHLTGLPLSHLPMAIASAARGSRASGGVAGGCPRQQRPGMGGRPKHPSPLQESCWVLSSPRVWGAAPTTPLGLPGALQSPFGTHFLSGRTARLPS